MDRLLARYPFLEAARAAVEEEGVEMAALVADGGPVVERATERVERCLETGTVGEPRRDPRTELLSYPVARALVSLLDRPVALRRYADAEARAAHDRFAAELADDRELRSATGRRLTLDRLLSEFDLEDRVEAAGEGFRVHVGPYLSLSAGLDGEEWRLVGRAVADGAVPVARDELFVLLREAVRERVAAGLPLSVPAAVAEGLAPRVEAVESLLADRSPPASFDAVVPEVFPPCVTALLRRVEAGESLPPHSRFSLVAFLASVGLAPGEIADLFAAASAGAEAARYQAEHLAGEGGSSYAPPSCATMDALGDCVNRDDRCATIDHPLAYYDSALEDAGSAADRRDSDAPLLDRLPSG